MHSPVVAVATPVALGQKFSGRSGAFLGAIPARAGVTAQLAARRDAATCVNEGFILVRSTVVPTMPRDEAMGNGK